MNLEIEIEQNAFYDLCFIKNGKQPVRRQSLFVQRVADIEQDEEEQSIQEENTPQDSNMPQEDVQRPETSNINVEPLNMIEIQSKDRSIPFALIGRKRRHTIASESIPDNGAETGPDVLS